MNHHRRVLNSEESHLRNPYKDRILPHLNNYVYAGGTRFGLSIHLISEVTWSVLVKESAFTICERVGVGVAPLVENHPWSIRI